MPVHRQSLIKYFFVDNKNITIHGSKNGTELEPTSHGNKDNPGGSGTTEEGT